MANYLVGKSLKDETEEYYKSREKRKFERHTSPSTLRKTEQDKYDPLRGSTAPISHLPIIPDEKKENRQTNLPTKSPEKKVNKRKVQEINELFIIKLVFDALNHVIESYLQ